MDRHQAKLRQVRPGGGPQDQVHQGRGREGPQCPLRDGVEGGDRRHREGPAGSDPAASGHRRHRSTASRPCGLRGIIFLFTLFILQACILYIFPSNLKASL